MKIIIKEKCKITIYKLIFVSIELKFKSSTFNFLFFQTFLSFSSYVIRQKGLERKAPDLNVLILILKEYHLCKNIIVIEHKNN